MKGACLQLEFDLYNYDAYNTYSDETGTFTLAQTGVYTGTEAIKEYAKFANVNSRYIQAKRTYVEESAMAGFDPKTNICKFRTLLRVKTLTLL